MAWNSNNTAAVISAGLSAVPDAVRGLSKRQASNARKNARYLYGNVDNKKGYEPGIIEQYNERAEQRARKYAMEDWLRDAEYNSPANQRRLLEEAGLNTALMYGDSMPAGSAPSPSETGTSREFDASLFAHAQDSSDFSHIASALRDGVTAYYQNSKLLNDIDRSNQYLELARQRLSKQSEWHDADSALASKRLDAMLDMNVIRKKQIESQIARNDVGTQLAAAQLRGYEDMLPLHRQQLIAAIAKAKVQKDMLDWDYSQRYERESFFQRGKEREIGESLSREKLNEEKRMQTNLQNEIMGIGGSTYQGIKHEVFDWATKLLDLGSDAISLKYNFKKYF